MKTILSRRSAVAALTGAIASAGAARAEQSDFSVWSVASPRRRILFEVRWDREAGLAYRVLLRPRRGRARVAVDWSALGLVTSVFTDVPLDAPILSDLSHSLTFVGLETSSGVDEYTLTTGKRRSNSARWEQIALTFRDAETERTFRLEARAYDEGAAFRYVLPETSPLHHWLMTEKTEFAIGLGGRHWGEPYDFVTMYTPSYETPYTDVPTGTPTDPRAGMGWGFPSLFERSGLWVLLHEAGLDETFHGSHLQPEAPGGVYKIAPPLREEALGFGANFAASTLPWRTPWRLMIVSDDIADIVQSNLVFHLSPPSRIEDASWIKPGIVSWNWLSDHGSGLDQAKLRAFIDLAAEMGWPYTLIDANWNLSGENAMADLVAYANAKNVGLLFWYNSGGRHNVVTEQPRNLMDDRVRRRAEFARLQALGVRGVKVDFLQSDKQDIIRLYLEILEDAAEHRLMANFHGCTIPRGWQRTWPNLMTMEAVRGAEFYSFPSQPDYGAIAPRLNAIHPFLRNVVGSMDYTPVLFSQFEVRRRTTNAHEAALAIVFESGLQHMADSVASYRSLPEDYKTYLHELPAVWDETRLLAGAPGQHVVLARRSGERWWIAGINGENAEKTITIDLSALPGLAGDALVLHDGDGFASRRRSAREGRTYRAHMHAFGGFALMFGS